MGEKTHQPSAQKLRDARKKGPLGRSKLFNSTSVTAGGLLGCLSLAPETSARLTWWTSKVLSLENIEPVAAGIEALKILAWCSLPALVGAFVGALVSAVVTAGFEVHLAVLTPDLQRLNPFEGLTKLFAPKQLFEVGKSLLVALIVGWLTWSGVCAAAPVAFRSVAHDGRALVILLEALATLFTKISGVLVALGVSDFALARWRHRRELMMSHEDVKQEHKNAEGDPHAKAARKAQHQRLAQGGAGRGVKRATAVVVNPTHLAVAIRYDEHECDAPYIVAKGRSDDALKIRREATTLGIPIVKDVPMARALIHYDVGDEVPEELYQAAAAVLTVAQEEADRRRAQEAVLR